MYEDDFTDLGKHKDRSRLKKVVLICAAIVLVTAVLLEVSNSRSDDKGDKSESQNQSDASNKKALGESSGVSTPTAPIPPPTPPPPIKLPESFSAKKDAVRNGSTESYAVEDSRGNTYYIIQQPALATLDIPGFEKKLTNTEKLTVPTGSATIGENNGQMIASIRTPDGKTWILITAVEVSLRPSLKDLVNAIRPS